LLVTTNTTIFLGTLAMNNVYYYFKHIVFTWAIHAGINFSMFGGQFSTGLTGFNDAQRFNLVLGSPIVTSVAGIALILSALILQRQKRTKLPQIRTI